MIAKLVPVVPFAVCALICCTVSSPQTQAVQRVRVDGNQYERKTLRVVIKDADVQVVEWDVG